MSQPQAPARVIFFGTAEFACPSLVALAEDKSYEVVLVITQPDRPKGRALKLQPSPMKAEAMSRGLPLLQPARSRDPAVVERLSEFKPALIVVAAYGQILSKSILELPVHGCLNVHASLLPKYRGAAPIQWAILNGESETGVTIMKMDVGLDTGDILLQHATPIEPSDNSQTVHDRLARLGAELLLKTIPDYVAGKIVPRKQPEAGTSYARKITKEDGRLNWSEPAPALWNRIRALTPWPGALTSCPVGGGARLMKIWEADVVGQSGGQPGEVVHSDKSGLVIACGEQALRILSLQIEGGRRLSAQEFLTGHPIHPGEMLR